MRDVAAVVEITGDYTRSDGLRSGIRRSRGIKGPNASVDRPVKSMRHVVGVAVIAGNRTFIVDVHRKREGRSRRIESLDPAIGRAQKSMENAVRVFVPSGHGARVVDAAGRGVLRTRRVEARDRAVRT